jgi:hypothetical protein
MLILQPDPPPALLVDAGSSMRYPSAPCHQAFSAFQ